MFKHVFVVIKKTMLTQMPNINQKAKDKIKLSKIDYRTQAKQKCFLEKVKTGHAAQFFPDRNLLPRS